MRQRVPELRAWAESLDVDDIVLLGMGGSSLAPEVLRRWFGAAQLHVLDTTHPAAIRRLVDGIELTRTLVIASSKSGTTLETRSHLDFFVDRGASTVVVVTDPGSELEQLANSRGWRVFHGEPTIGGRYSALSPFGLVPAAAARIDIEALLDSAEAMHGACRVAEHNPGLELGIALGAGWEQERDKVVLPEASGLGLWLEQLLAESTGKNGKGLLPAPGESPDGPDRQAHDVEVAEPSELGGEFFRWMLATAVAGALLRINPFDQPNVQEAKDRTSDVLSGPDPGTVPGTWLEGSVDELLAGAAPPEYVAIQAFVDPAREAELAPLAQQARATGCVVTVGLGPRYLHSTGQLHKGGPPTGRFLQVVDDTGEELPIPGRKFGFGRLIRAQAAGDYAALKERGRPVARIRLEDT
jgi:hypothetical protein